MEFRRESFNHSKLEKKYGCCCAITNFKLKFGPFADRTTKYLYKTVVEF